MSVRYFGDIAPSGKTRIYLFYEICVMRRPFGDGIPQPSEPKLVILQKLLQIFYVYLSKN